MARFVEGKWMSRWDVPLEKGRFERADTTFRDFIRADGSTPYAPAKGRYHLYVSYACPWAHRTLIARKLKGLEGAVSVSVVHWLMGEDGWTFDEGPGVVPDPIANVRFFRDVYLRAVADFTGRVTVPVLWDRELGTIVNNESREIVRMFGSEMGALADPSIDLCPADLRPKIDETIDAIYQPINNGVYRAGFAGSQEAYDEAVDELFAALDHWEGVLNEQRYLTGDRFTEADICLFTTLARFDLVYHTHFKCNVRRIVDYPALWAFTREIYQMPGVAETCRFDHIKGHYYASHTSLNPLGIIARGPGLDWAEPHGRDRLSST